MRAYSILTASCAAFLLSSCGPSIEGPQTEDIKQFLEMNLKEGFDAQDIEIQAAQNIGDEIEPIYRSRIKMNIGPVDKGDSQEDQYVIQGGFWGGYRDPRFDERRGMGLP